MGTRTDAEAGQYNGMGSEVRFSISYTKHCSK